MHREAIQGVYGPRCVFDGVVVDEGVAEADLSQLVLNELAALNGPDGAEEALHFVFSHCLRQVVYDKIGLRLAFGALGSRITGRAKYWYSRHFFFLIST